MTHTATGSIITAQNFLLRGIVYYLIIKNAISGHINAHICRAFIGRFSHNTLHHSIKHRENFYITVIVYCSFSVCLQMVGVYHINIIKVGGCGLISKIDRRFKGNVPNRKGFKLGISRLYTTLIFVIKLRKAYRHFSASRSGGCNNHQRTLCFNKIVLAEAVITYNKGYICRIILYRIVLINLNTERTKPFFKLIGSRLSAVAGYNNTAHEKTYASKCINKAKGIHIVGYTKIPPALIGFNSIGINNNNNFGLVLKLKEHTNLTVGIKTRQNTGGMIIVEQLTPELHIQLAAETGNTLPYLFGLKLNIFVIIKPDFAHFCGSF